MRTIASILLALFVRTALPVEPAHAIFALPEGFEAGVYGEVKVSSSHGDLEQRFDDERWDPSPVTNGQFVLSLANEAGLNSAATVVGQVGYGWARLDVIAIARHHGEGISDADAYGAVGFADEITISAPGLDGTSGSLTAGVFIDGALSSAHSRYDDFVRSGAIAASAVNSSVAPIMVASPSDALDPAANLDDEFFGGASSFVYGQPFWFAFRLEVEGNARVDIEVPGDHSGVSSFVGDFGHTMTWAGVLDLRDASDAPVVDFDVTSLSGTDYPDRIVPVPEPGSALPVLAALTWLARGVVGARRARYGPTRRAEALDPCAAEPLRLSTS